MQPIVHPSSGILSSNPLADTWHRAGKAPHRSSGWWSDRNRCRRTRTQRKIECADAQVDSSGVDGLTRRAQSVPEVRCGGALSATDDGLHPSVPAMRTPQSRRATSTSHRIFASVPVRRTIARPSHVAHPLFQAIPQEPPLLQALLWLLLTDDFYDYVLYTYTYEQNINKCTH